MNCYMPYLKFKVICLLTFSLVGSTLLAQEDTFLVKPYLQFATKSEMTFLWETTRKSTGVLHYTKAKPSTDAVEFEHKVELDSAATLHEVTLSGLEVNTKYLYQVVADLGNGQSITSEVSTFKTNVGDKDAFFFAFVGDSQRNSKTPMAWGEIAQRIFEDRPNFIVHAGDLVDKGTVKKDWTEHFFPQGNIAMSRYPTYTVLGNHEQDAQNYYDYMSNPAPEYYYTFHYGNSQFFMIDTNKDISEGSEQYNWLEWQLAKSKAVWKFVVHHHPPYSSDSDDFGDTFKGLSSKGLENRNLVPLYEAYDVDFCLYGHTHLYERTWPIYEEAINQKDGVIYINSGGAGGSIENFDPVRSWFTMELQAVHHYCTFAVFENKIVFKAVDLNGNLFDSFEMVKAESQVTKITSPPAPKIKFGSNVFEESVDVSLAAFSDELEVRYTLDGREPGIDSKRYTTALEIDKSCTIKAASFTKDGRRSRMISQEFSKMRPQKATIISPGKNGLRYKYVEGEFAKLPDFSSEPVVKEGIVSLPNLGGIEVREDHFAIQYTGLIEVDETGSYTFYTYSDDGSQLLINDHLLVDSDGDHSAQYITGTTILEKGLHKIEIRYFEARGGSLLHCGFITETKNKVSFSPWQLFHGE